ncbi:MAG: hypothetical protein U0X74_08735 [Anaerolineales bacterium]
MTNNQENNSRQNKTRKKISSEMKISLISAVIGAILGSFLTTTFPWIFEYIFSSPQTIDASPQDISDWYRGIDNRYQADQLAKNLYYGKYVKWTGTVSDIYSYSPTTISLSLKINTDSYSGISVSAEFDTLFNNNKERISSLITGKRVTVLCRITDISFGNWISLDNCRLIEVLPALPTPTPTATYIPFSTLTPFETFTPTPTATTTP